MTPTTRQYELQAVLAYRAAHESHPKEVPAHPTLQQSWAALAPLKEQVQTWQTLLETVKVHPELLQTRELGLVLSGQAELHVY